MRTNWMRRWSTEFPNGVSRLEFIMQLRAAIDKFDRRQTVWVDGPTVARITDRGLLNYRQVAALLGMSHEHVRRIAQSSEPVEPIGPRGKIDRFQLDMLYLLVQQLTLGRMPNEWMLHQLPDCGDISIVSFLCGVPKSTITRYRQDQEVRDGFVSHQ